MPHFKRKGPKSTRAGCLMCKPHKAQWAKGSRENQTLQEQKAREAEEPERFWPRAKKGPKAFTLECRDLTRDVTPRGDWYVYRRYRTEQGRDDALRSLSRPGRWKRKEFRAGA